MISTKTVTTLANIGSHNRHWYERASASIRDYAARHNLSADYVADVVALLSPGVTVSANAKLAKAYLERGQLPNEGIYRKSTIITLNHYLATGEIRGPKVAAFARNLKGDFEAVTLDRHMARIMATLSRETVSGGLSFRRPARRMAVKRVQEAARNMGWTPAQVQASVWQAARMAVGAQVKDTNDLTLGD